MADLSRFPLGSTLTLDSLSVDPYPQYRRLIEREPVTWVPEVNLWYVLRREDVVAVLDNAVVGKLTPENSVQRVKAWEEQLEEVTA